MNAVSQLYQYRKSISTTVYKSRGFKLVRCEVCRVAKENCICDISPLNLIKNTSSIETSTAKGAGFLLLMYDTEILKPSNTGKLVADLIPDTYAFLWSRTEVNPDVLALLNDEQWQPYVVFPAQYAQEGREVIQNKVNCPQGKRPLFILLDGSWREAKKMFRKSPYLNNFPMVSFDPTKFIEQSNPDNPLLVSRYQIRFANGENQFATAEVAARVLAMANEHEKAHILDLWFDVFNYRYQISVCQSNKGNPQAIDNYKDYIQSLTKANFTKEKDDN